MNSYEEGEAMIIVKNIMSTPAGCVMIKRLVTEKRL